jgi:UDP-2,4-diacetamido-2,4,6-trideoxy-beta-L-altropyranose hydrolase
MKKVLFRFDVSKQTGYGHYIRCKSIIDEINKKGGNIPIFIMCNSDAEIFFDNVNVKINKLNTFESELSQLIKYVINNNIQVIFIDNLHQYTKYDVIELKKFVRIIFFHNLCEGSMFGDVFILPSMHHNQSTINKYANNSLTKFFHGANYIVLNSEILKMKLEQNIVQYNAVAITTGGSDPKGVLIKILEYLEHINMDQIQFQIQIGNDFCHMDKLNKFIVKGNSNFHFYKYNPEIYFNVDFVISTFGVSTYEFLYLGKPVISIGHAEKNAAGSEILSKKLPFFTNLGLIDHLKINELEVALKKYSGFSINDLRYANMQLSGIIDGKGIDRIIKIIYE